MAAALKILCIALCMPQEAGVVGGAKSKGPFAVVMAPTRELALQINQVSWAHASRSANAFSLLPLHLHVCNMLWRKLAVKGGGCTDRCDI